MLATKRPCFTEGCAQKKSEEITRGLCAEEIKHVGDCASSNNLRLNQVMSTEIIFVSPRCRRAVVIPLPAVPTTLWVKEIQALGITMSQKFSVALDVDHLLVSCVQSLFALRTLSRGVMGTRKVGRERVSKTRPKLRIPAGNVKHYMK